MTVQTMVPTDTVGLVHRGLMWAIKSTFTTYVESMSDGEVSVFDGAVRRSDGSFFFPLASDVSCGSERVMTFTGMVQFTGHRGMLVISIGGLQLIDDGESMLLTIEDSLMPDGRLTLVELPSRQIEGETTRFPEPTLTEDGADLFFENYRVGTQFEPLWLISRAES